VNGASAAGHPVRWLSPNAPVVSGVRSHMEEVARVDLVLMPLFGSLLALAGALLLFADWEFLVPKAIPARAATARNVRPARDEADHVNLVNAIKQVATEGRELDVSPGPDLEGMPLVLVVMANVQHRKAHDSEVFSSSRLGDLPTALADMADMQRMHRWTGSCPCPLQGGAIRCPASADSDDWIASAMFGPGLAEEASRPSGHSSCPMHDVNRIDIVSEAGADLKEATHDDH
jgi:hypothetical protein